MSKKEFVMIQQPLETEKEKNHTTVFNTRGQSPHMFIIHLQTANMY
jgi:hypothetical protein